jgi:hypothetical protein
MGPICRKKGSRGMTWIVARVAGRDDLLTHHTEANVRQVYRLLKHATNLIGFEIRLVALLRDTDPAVRLLNK